jgi:hypothetical protein
MDHIHKNNFEMIKKERREKKRKIKRNINAEEVIFIFEKVLEGWKTIRIYNALIQNNPNSRLDKSKIETIASGNCKVYEDELTLERYNYYLSLREKVYEMQSKKSK